MPNYIVFCLISIFIFSTSVNCYGSNGFNPFKYITKGTNSTEQPTNTSVSVKSQVYSPVYMGPQFGLKERDKIISLPGQPLNGVLEFNQYSGYVTVDEYAGTALFYYFVESFQDPEDKPLVLWLSGGRGCSAFGIGAMMEIGPFRVSRDGETLEQNEYAWNIDANVIFLEAPAGVGFSYSNTSDYTSNGDWSTAWDSCTFIVNWLERFSEYKNRDFFIAGEAYAGHFAPQLARQILYNNMYTDGTKINLKGIALGNAFMDDDTYILGWLDYFWSHAFMPDDVHQLILSNCNFSSPNVSLFCQDLLDLAVREMGNIYAFNIYAPSCNVSFNSSCDTFLGSDPCSSNYIEAYLNNPQVQMALHANVPATPYFWESCSPRVSWKTWEDSPDSVLPVIKELMSEGIRIWLYSGDADGVVPITSTRYAINKLQPLVQSWPWHAWYTQGEVGGYAVEYENLTFVSVRAAGHFVPSYQPARALVLFSSFIQGKLPPSA
ncbi:serine carboxypeptidase 1-like [Mercurialis annua]|uniref:serine carboxypeptidase 1-like n=1 Tax=Mercurialis annua TaxID=3986 RepID=UPI00215ED7D8|nr:serine carboxypeptidase 1-like [Mercurialis annua]